VVLVVAVADNPDVGAAMLRARAWGAETVWLGVGPRPPAGSADHVLWLPDPDGSATHTGDVVLLYHVLWELTHVCFEHPGLLAAPCTSGPDEVCITCSDEGRLGEVVTTSLPDLATVRTPAGAEEIDTTLVGPVHAGDLVLIHAGTAIERLASAVDDR
jgi:hypothetical protein